MPRGIPKGKIVEMSEAELDAIETPKPVIPEKKVEVVGSLEPKKLTLEELRAREQAQKLFPYTPAKKEGWIKMNPEEMAQFEADGLLAGYDPYAGIGLIKKRG